MQSALPTAYFAFQHGPLYPAPTPPTPLRNIREARVRDERDARADVRIKYRLSTGLPYLYSPCAPFITLLDFNSI